MTPRERLHEWFTNHYESEQFRLSMGEIRLNTAGFNVLLGFLAEGVALVGYEDNRYLMQLVATHEKLAGMIEDLQKIPGHDQTSEYHYPLILGVLIEKAVEAVHQLKKEDRGD